METIIPKNHSLFVDGGDFASLIDRLRKNGRLNNYELSMKRQDGTKMWTLSNTTPAPGNDDETGIRNHS